MADQNGTVSNRRRGKVFTLIQNGTVMIMHKIATKCPRCVSTCTAEASGPATQQPDAAVDSISVRTPDGACRMTVFTGDGTSRTVAQSRKPVESISVRKPDGTRCTIVFGDDGRSRTIHHPSSTPPSETIHGRCVTRPLTTQALFATCPCAFRPRDVISGPVSQQTNCEKAIDTKAEPDRAGRVFV